MILHWLTQQLFGAHSKGPVLSYKVPLKKIGRRLVIPDIHGCIHTLEVLLNRLALQKEDQVFFLGDYINKGPDSKAVLDVLLHLQQTYPDIHFLKGNHEDQLLKHKQESETALLRYLQEYQSENLLEQGQLPKRFTSFFENLPYFIDTGDYYLVHAGFNFSARNPWKDYEAMLMIRDYPVDQNWLSYKRIVHGHNPKPLGIIQHHIREFGPVIPLDNGCVYHGQREDHGNLLCFDLDTQRVIIQPNVE